MKEKERRVNVHTKEGPPEINQGKRQRPTKQLRHERVGLCLRAAPIAPEAMAAEQGAMPEAPCDEMQPGTMPEAAEHHGQQNIPINEDGANPRPTQGNEDVVDEPSIQGHVPATPELRDVRLKIGPIEVFLDLDSK